ncbi:conjugal transfer ATP-binding protein TraC [Chlamydia trachomatis]|nr:conjugal transfer ATP-binding protein TraC [Chlamydia trachomatis]CRH54772.1 conjugal transfer ATP-binding protein TraC [Chlamydia trachomatis]CRH54784.1 conjugal transfer ATP-binding protein TraC [Chlamydia trachomatis]
MYLILNFVQNKITNNFVLNKDNKRILIVVDEAHKFISNKNQAIIDFLFDTVKTIRKYNGSLILTTQQPSDFAQDSTIATKTQAIIENIDYSLILRLNQKDLDAVNSMYKSRGGLNKSEITFISTAAIGEGLMNIGSNNRILMQLYYNELEKEIIFKKGDLSQLS